MLYTIMATDPDLEACTSSFLKYTSHMFIQNLEAINHMSLLISSLKIKTKIKHAPLEFHLQLNIIYSYFADESFLYN
jgi:hypothetical protein